MLKKNASFSVTNSLPILPLDESGRLEIIYCDKIFQSDTL